MFSSVLVCLSVVASAVVARPAVREVVVPPITFPTASTVWTVGETTHVDWDTSTLPPYNQITNNKGQVVLGYEDPCDPDGGEHLDLDHPLATGFNITLGTIPVTVPDVQPRSDYILVLFGDSGNLSPMFSINVAISGGNGQAPPVRVACTSSTISAQQTSSTSASPESSSTSTTKAITSYASSSTTVSTATPASISTALTPTTTDPASTRSVSALSTGSVSALSTMVSGSALASSGSLSGTSVRPTALPQSQSASAAGSHSTNSASHFATSRMIAILSSAAALFLALP